LVAAAAGCGSPPSAVGTHTAQVKINGQRIEPAPSIRCMQQGWNWIIETPNREGPGFRAAISTGEKAVAQSVEIRELENFTGSYWQGTVGDGTASMNSGGTISISGTAKGEFGDNSDAAEVTYDITTKC
jgi:hypothetical protein